MRSVQIAIPEPCQENWHEMTATDQGRYWYFISASILCLLFSLNGFSQNTDGITKILAVKATSCFLIKQQNAQVTKDTIRSKKEPVKIKLACPRSLNTSSSGLLYVLDGKRVESNNINTDSVEDVTLLQPPAATAIFGIDGRNGAMVITSKRSILSKVKTLDTVKVAGSMYRRCLRTHCNSITRITSCGINTSRDTSFQIDHSLIKERSNDDNLLGIYPNPIQKGNTFSISLKLKQTGTYHIQIADAIGRILLQKQTNILSKEYMEQVQTDSRWSSGVYYIRVFDNNNKPIGKDSFIVQ